MRKFYTLLPAMILAIISSVSINAQNSFFTDKSESSITVGSAKKVITPLKFRTVEIDLQRTKDFLWSLPDGRAGSYNRSSGAIFTIPKPDGTNARFRVWQSSIQEPGLEAKFPEIRTFAGQGIDDPYATIRFDITPRGFHAQVLSVNGAYYLDPYAIGNTTYYISYFRHDVRKGGTWSCGVDEAFARLNTTSTSNLVTAACRGTDLRTYRLAVACTGEYAQAPGISAGTNPSILHAAIVTSVNRVVGVYQKELAISMVLVANNNLVEFLNAATDPFTGNNDANTLINESQTVINANIGSANYDIGHTFSTGGGGLAQLNSPCGTSKARGITGSSNPTGDAYDIDYVAHEMGHQFGGNHSMNGCGSSPTSTKYEPGSGTTIQAYAGICGAENIQPNSDPHFHGISFDEISNFVSGAGCGTSTSTSNGIPVIGALPPNVSIPSGTPFTLTGTATDPNSDPLTYCWEQWDLGNPGASWNIGLTAPAGNTAPLFKSRVPKTNGSRTFPDMAVILAGYPASPSATMGGLKGEVLSPVARPMKFRLTVRDNRAGGGGVASAGGGGCQSSSAVTVTTVGTTPFTVTAPNGGENYPGNSSQTVTWNVAGSASAPVSTANVKISLSTDGGNTYPTVLLASTPNDGTQAVTIPVVTTTTARIKVEAVGNIFFDIGNANFTISGVVTCVNPTGLTPSSITSTSATVGWSAVSGALSYDVDYKAASSGTWINAVTATTSLTRNITGLNPGTLYDWRVRTNCSGSSSIYSTAQFTTTCVNPTGLISSAVTNNGATLSWSAVSGALNYSVDYKAASSGTWIVLTSSTVATTINVSILNNGTLYDWRVRTNCNSGASTYSTAQFTTGCGNPTGLTTSSITNTSATLSWTTVTGALSYSVDYKAASSGTWLVVTASTAAVTVNVSGLSGSILYDWRVRTNCSVGTSIFSTAQFTTSCGNPGSLTSSAITNTTATLSWSIVTEALNYSVEFKPASSGTWLNGGTTAATTINLNALSSGTLYDWRVKANCTSGSGVFVAAQFTTTSPPPCGPVTGLSSSVTTISASVTWTAVSGGLNYDVDYKVASSGTWINAATGTTLTTVNLSSLSTGTVYDWRVRANCTSLSSVYATAQFTTSSPPGTCGSVTGLITSSVTNASVNLGWNILPGALNYDVDYKTAVSGIWLNAVSGTTMASSVITALSSSTLYDWRVRANCTGATGSYTNGQFTTGSAVTVCNCSGGEPRKP